MTDDSELRCPRCNAGPEKLTGWETTLVVCEDCDLIFPRVRGEEGESE